MKYDSERLIAVESVLQACSLCRKVQSAYLSHEVIGKMDGSPVTVADFGAQAVVSHCLMRSFPNDPLVAEEDSQLLRESGNAAIKSAVFDHVKNIIPELNENQILETIDRGSGEGGPKGRFWTLDPIDGTKGFLRGDQYAVALALVEEGKIVLGVLGCPSLPLHGLGPVGRKGCLLVAVEGEGSAMRSFESSAEQKVEVTRAVNPSEALFCESYESSHSSYEASARVLKVLGVRKLPLRIDSQCKYGVLARGDASVYLRIPMQESYLESIWDHAAGSIIVEEAGGKVTDIYGKPLDFSSGRRLLNNRGILATNGRLHDLVLETVQQRTAH
jgi:HAL2 family 3'(2'),5'-bisphosphate nucleotidase